MTLNLIFVTVTIKKRKQSLEACVHEQRINQIIDENKMKYCDLFYRNM
ncbi:YrzI family small protein [Heyndrickxia oleronia]|nr:YrzI family small protein [Heyndrickxia oleronia]MCM3237085.1 YrzI family small protein [Heyndrickxia oleronia]